MMLLKIDINKWFSWLNLGIKDPSTASAVEVLLQIAVICLIAFLFTFFLRKGITRVIGGMVRRTKTKWDDIFFEDELLKARSRDLKLCQTTVGPHRDDMLFSVDGVDIRKYGSQGQQRTSALSLKLSEISLVKKNINSTPVLLLDDVLSELDGNRQNYLLNSLSDTQTIITCTGLDEFVKNRFQVDKVFHVVKGQVEVIDE